VITPFHGTTDQLLLIDLVQLVVFTSVQAGTACDDEHRDTVQKCFAYAAERIGDTCAGDNQADAHVAGGTAETISSKRGAFFMGDQDRIDLLGMIKLIINFEVLHTGNSKGVGDG
jgi:hypothetical protein